MYSYCGDNINILCLSLNFLTSMTIPFDVTIKGLIPITNCSLYVYASIKITQRALKDFTFFFYQKVNVCKLRQHLRLANTNKYFCIKIYL